MDIKKRALELQDEVVANRRWLHQHPELGFQLDSTVAFVKENRFSFDSLLSGRGKTVFLPSQGFPAVV